METARWNVYAPRSTEAWVECALSVMSECEGIEIVPTMDVLQGVERSVGVIFVVASASAIVSSLKWLLELRHQRPDVAAVFVARGLDAETLASLFRAGMQDFIEWPSSVAEFAVRLRRAAGSLNETPTTAAASAARPAVRGFVYASSACAMVAAKLPFIGSCSSNVLICGETGTGKEVCAQAVHYLSARASRPWVAVNCGAIPAELVENEMFGHAKGAYTTAHAARSGLVREADGGTLFLDEIDCLPLQSQAKLLRFLQEREYRPVGSNTVMRADVRVIASSNTDLYALAREGRFRLDLYFRLNVLVIDLPALRERREDIPVLAMHFMRQFANEFGRESGALSPGALRRLFAHDWPGNVRELRHVIERAVLLAPTPTLRAEDIDIDRVRAGAPGSTDDESFRRAKTRVIERFERGYVEQLLSEHGGNVTHAAQAAKKDRRAFFELIRKHRIEPRRFRPIEP